MLIKVITQFVNESIFPTALKTAVVKPIHKSGDKLQVSNYQPISIHPTISKVFKEVVAAQLVKHLGYNAALHPLQLNFRKRYSTVTAYSYLIEEIKSSLDSEGVVGVVFLDLRIALDTLNHELLIDKLTHFSISTSTVNCIQSYLRSRKHCVSVNNVSSPLRAYAIGVLQGSILGPLLFTLYINDFPSVCINAKMIMYTDDTVVYIHVKLLRMQPKSYPRKCKKHFHLVEKLI